MSRARIAFCITGLGIGGAERCLSQLADRLPREHFAPEVHSLLPPPEEGRTELVDRLTAAEIPISFYNARSVWDAPRVVRQLAGSWRARRPALVQSMLYHANVTSAWAARRAGIRLHVSGIRGAERTAPRRAWLEARCLRRADRHVCVSKSVADYAAQAGRLDPEKLVVIPNGIDPTRFAGALPLEAAELGIPAGQRAILFLGRFDEQKQVVPLIRLAEKFLRPLPEHCLLLAGEGRLYAEVEAARAASPVRERIHLLGLRSDVPRLLKSSQLLVLPSLWEGMPQVVLEAMAAGLPVVATDVEGVGECLGPSAPAQVVPPGDPAAFCQRIVELLQHPRQAAELGSVNRQRVSEQFSLESMVARYAALYDSILGR